MPLEFTPLEIPFGNLDTNTDPTALQIGDLTKAENVSSLVDGRYGKRNGLTTLAASAATDAVRLAKRGKELLVYSKNTQYKYIPELTTWSPWTLPVPRVKPTERNIALEQSKNYYKSTRASASGMTLHAYIDNGTGDVLVRVFSDTDGALLTSYTDSTSDYELVHAVQVSTSVVVVFYSSVASQVIRYRTFDASSLAFGTLTTYQSGANVYAGSVPFPYAPFDVCAMPGSTTDVLFTWCTNTPDIQVVRRNVITHANTYAPVILTTEVPDGGFAIGTASTTVGGVAFHSSTTPAVRIRGFNPSTGAALYALTTVEADGATGTNWNVGITSNSSTSLMVCLDRRKVAPAIGSSVVYMVSSGGAVTGGFVVYNVWLAAKPYTYNSKQYIPVLAPYRTQDTIFTLDTTEDGGVGGNRVPIAMHAYRTAHHDGAGVACLPDIDNPSTGKYAFDAPTAYKFLSTSSIRAAATTFELDFEDPLRFLNTEMGDSVYLTGGLNFRYDGTYIAENNFCLYPEIVSATPGAVGAGGMNNGTYSYIVVYEVSDQNGNVDRSTTSLPMSATTSAGAGLGKVDLVISSLNVSYHILTGQTVVASVFRTEASGSTYYHLTSIEVGRTFETVSYTDQANDTTILSNRIIYTQGGILDREPALPSRQLINHNNRMWGFNGKTIFYSGDYVPGENPWFSTIQRFSLDPGGDITAIASLDDKLIIFKAGSIFKVYGRGGNAQGANSDLSPPAYISSDCGCIDPRSIVAIPQGLMFHGPKGMYLLTRGEELSFAGEPIAAYLDTYPTVTAATMMPEISEVRFQVSNGSTGGLVLVYNYRDNRWTTHTNYDHLGGGGSQNRVDSLIVDDVYYNVSPAANVMKETTGFRDVSGAGAGNYVASEIETGWIKPAGKQGLARCQRMTFLNEFVDDHDLEIEIDKDYVDVAVQTASFTSAEIEALPEEQVSIHIQNQQGQAWRVRMTDATSVGATTYEGFRAKGVTFLVAAKRGTIEKAMQAGAKA